MRNSWIIALTATAAAVLLPASVAGAEGEPRTPTAHRPPVGSLAGQLLLKFRLQKIANGTLTASLNHNRAEWEGLTPEQRQRYRNEALAFLKADPGQVQKLVERYDRFLALPPQKQAEYRSTAEWVEAVVATLSPQERERLLAMPPDDRAKFLRDRRDELVRQGKLQLPPATQPAAATAPAAK